MAGTQVNNRWAWIAAGTGVALNAGVWLLLLCLLIFTAMVLGYLIGFVRFYSKKYGGRLVKGKEKILAVVGFGLICYWQVLAAVLIVVNLHKVVKRCDAVLLFAFAVVEFDQLVYSTGWQLTGLLIYLGGLVIEALNPVKNQRVFFGICSTCVVLMFV